MSFISGRFNSIGGLDFGDCDITNGPYIAHLMFSTPTTFSIISGALGGPDAAHFALVDPFPFSIFPGNAEDFQISFTPNAVRTFNATVTFTWQVGFKFFHATYNLTGVGLAHGAPCGGFNYPSIQFPAGPIGVPQVFPPNVVLQNQSSVPITVNSMAFGGASFALVGAPVMPFTLAPGASSAVFQVQYTPAVVGAETDTLTAVLAAGPSPLLQVGGTGIQITPVFDLTGATQDTLFGFSGEIDALDPNDYDTEEVAIFQRLHDWGLTCNEKQIMRVRGHYQDYGLATINVTVQTRRLDPADNTNTLNQIITKPVEIGTNGATDGWVREFFADFDAVGELIQIQVERDASSGPVFIVDYIPCLEPKGEVVAG